MGCCCTYVVLMFIGWMLFLTLLYTNSVNALKAITCFRHTGTIFSQFFYLFFFHRIVAPVGRKLWFSSFIHFFVNF